MTSGLKACLEAIGAEPHGYSGRGMYGKRCVAITVDDFADAVQKMLELAEELIDSGRGVHDMPEARWDSMGHGYVVYWPQEEWVDG